MAYFDEDGYYYIAGRKKRFIKVMGKRVNMDEMEELLKSAFDFSDFACVGQDDDLHVFMTNNTHQSEVEDFLIEKTGLHLRCFTIHHIKQIPKNTSGKTQYPELKALAEKQG